MPPPASQAVAEAPLPVTDTGAVEAAGAQAAAAQRRRRGFAATLLSRPETRETGSVAKKVLLGE